MPKVRILPREKGKICFILEKRFLLQLECYPPWWWHIRYEKKPGFLRLGWGLWQIYWMTYSFAETWKGSES